MTRRTLLLALLGFRIAPKANLWAYRISGRWRLTRSFWAAEMTYVEPTQFKQARWERKL